MTWSGLMPVPEGRCVIGACASTIKTGTPSATFFIRDTDIVQRLVSRLIKMYVFFSRRMAPRRRRQLPLCSRALLALCALVEACSATWAPTDLTAQTLDSYVDRERCEKNKREREK